MELRIQRQPWVVVTIAQRLLQFASHSYLPLGGTFAGKRARYSESNATQDRRISECIQEAGTAHDAGPALQTAWISPRLCTSYAGAAGYTDSLFHRRLRIAFALPVVRRRFVLVFARLVETGWLAGRRQPAPVADDGDKPIRT